MSPDYVIHTDEEPLRLERQARLYDMSAELRRLALDGCRRVLDAGCGSGAMARAIARAAPQAEVIGIDREARYIDFARRRAAEEGLHNLRFEVGDVTALPLPAGHVDRVWSKHLLQWVVRRGATAFTEQVFGGPQAAQAFGERLMRHLGDPDVFVACPMYYVRGRKPG